MTVSSLSQGLVYGLAIGMFGMFVAEFMFASMLIQPFDPARI